MHALSEATCILPPARSSCACACLGQGLWALLRRVVRLAVVLVVRVVSFHVPYPPSVSACFAMGVAVGVRLAGWVCYMHPSHAGCCPRCGNAHSSLRSAVVGDDTGCFFLLFVSGREGATSYVVAPTLLPSSHVSGCVVCVGAVLAATRPLCPCFRVFQCAYACVMLRRSHIAM